MENKPLFIHLRTHTSYSLLEGAILPEELSNICKDESMPAVGITDTGNMFGSLEISEKLSKDGIQPIIGCQLDIKTIFEGFEIYSSIVLIAKDASGYKNLMKLSSSFYLKSQDEKKHITVNHLEQFNKGLICLSGGPNGLLGSLFLKNKKKDALKICKWLKEVFKDRLYIELQRHPDNNKKNLKAEQETEPFFLELAYENNIPLVATNDVYFKDSKMFEAHDALLCIADGVYVDQTAKRRKLTPEHYFKSSSEMCELFSDLPEAIRNTIIIAKRCSVKAELKAPILPKFANNEVDELYIQSSEGLKKRLLTDKLIGNEKDYWSRLNYELEVIKKMGFPGYFLIVADFIKWAKNNRIPVGPGRGSGAGSMVAYSLEITDLDPIRYGLLFERFLNPDRVSMPDFDIDFCMERREEVIKYVQKKYGSERVAHIITFGALLSKAAVRDIGRVLQVPYNKVDTLAKMIPLDGTKPLSISQAIEQEPKLKEASKESEVINRLLNYAQKVEGLLRNAATHAAGIVIADKSLEEMVPLYKDPRSEMPATQFNMKWVEQAGLVKFDFLGLKTLTVIQNALDLISLKDIQIDITKIPLDDKKTFVLYSEAKTTAVFQVESSGMKDALRQLRPTKIEDIIALVALYRPGPMENIPTFCKVKNNNVQRKLIHPLIDNILDETQGIIVYQEQVMQIARQMGGYSLAEADLLRRAMGKKIKSAMDNEKPRFLEGAKKNGVNNTIANSVWNLLKKFANYGFNKSHAAGYAILSYQTAWLKANYPVEFMAAIMNCDITYTDKLAIYKREIDQLKINLISPCINLSDSKFTVLDGSLIYALSALKNVGVSAMDYIVEIRASQGDFKTIFDFARRVDLKKIGKRSLESLIRAGTFDKLFYDRGTLLTSIDKIVSYSESMFFEKTTKQSNLFSLENEFNNEPEMILSDEWSNEKKLEEELSSVGYYLSGHPLDQFLSEFNDKQINLFSFVKENNLNQPKLYKMVGIINNIQEKISAKGNKIAFLQLSDPSGIYEVIIFSDLLKSKESFIRKGKIVVLDCVASFDRENIRLVARNLNNFLQEEDKNLGKMFIKINDNFEPKDLANALKNNKEEKNKKFYVSIKIISFNFKDNLTIALPENFLLDNEDIDQIKKIDGVLGIEMIT